LEPVGSDFRRVETVSREVRESELPVYGPGAATAARGGSLRSEAPEVLRAVAALLWQCWLIAAGTGAGLVVLVVLLRVLVTVGRWAL
jgi:hypothetical protein